MNTDNMEKLGNMGSNWLDEDNSNEYDWFDKMVIVYQDLKDDETLHEGIKRDGFNMLKKRFKSSIEFEYHLEQVALAMSEDIDWENPESNIDPATLFYVDHTKALPISSLVEYNEDVEHGIHHWPKMHNGFYKWKMANTSKHKCIGNPRS
ncbi:hypothetical protein Tco_0645017 [Tanacetum coccineum]